MTHEKEIKYWAEHPNGTRVWCKTEEYGWVRNSTTWSPDKLYIVDNEWAKLRMANADGRTIQFNMGMDKWIDEERDWWKTDFYQAVGSPNTLSEFRIKPKEWYEDIPPEGVICWVWDEEGDKRIDVITGYKTNHMCPFYGKTWKWSWRCAEPIKPEECGGTHKEKDI